MKKKLYCISLLLLFLLPFVAAVAVPAANRPEIFALVIGISQYADPSIPPLKYADKDASAFDNLLRTTAAGMLPSQNIVTLLNENATRPNIIAELERLLSAASADDLFIFYFSGHGAKSGRNGNGYLLGYDSKNGNEVGTALAMYNDVCQKIEQSAARMKLSYVDACHAGLFPTGAKGQSDYNVAAALQQSVSEVWEGYAMFLSSSPQQFSKEDTASQNGYFTRYLLEGLKGAADRYEPALQGYRNGVVTISELENYLTQKVRQATRFTQTPSLQGKLYNEQFPLSVTGNGSTSLIQEIAKLPNPHKNSDKNNVMRPATPLVIIQRQVDVFTSVTLDTEVQPGDSLSIKVEGRINLSLLPLECGPDGLTGHDKDPYSYFPKAPHGALLMRVGNNPYILCGSSRKGVTSFSGKLQFLVNDKDDWNNTGFFRVNLEIYKGYKKKQ